MSASRSRVSIRKSCRRMCWQQRADYTRRLAITTLLCVHIYTAHFVVYVMALCAHGAHVPA